MVVNDEKFIFLVEDDKDDQQLFEKAAAACSFAINVSVAKNGDDALNQLEHLEKLPDLIFLDINMPMMNGLEFLRVIKKDERLSTIKIFMLSTAGDPVSVSIAKRLGANGYISKPYNYNELCETMERAMSYVFTASNIANVPFYKHVS